MFVLDLLKEMDEMRGSRQNYAYDDENYQLRDFPLTNVVEKGDDYEVHSLIPGVDPKDIDISYENRVLTLSGERKSNVDKENQYVSRERVFGKFKKQLKIPVPVNPETIEAHYKDGVLIITMSKAEEAKPVKIKVS